MNEVVAAVLSVLGFGMLTTVHPCSVALNISGVSAICSPPNRLGSIIIDGFIYIQGRMVSYMLIGALFVLGSMMIPSLVNLSRYYINKLIGPLFIVVGMMISGLLYPAFFKTSARNLTRLGGSGRLTGIFLLGVVHSFSFCPVSAGLFFGIVIPMAVEQNVELLLSLVYGFGTGLPLFILVIFTTTGMGFFSFSLRVKTGTEKWFPIIAGGVMIVIGVYLTLSRVFEVHI
jgi:cytochrome c biogenesis protein CcdA